MLPQYSQTRKPSAARVNPEIRGLPFQVNRLSAPMILFQFVVQTATVCCSQQSGDHRPSYILCLDQYQSLFLPPMLLDSTSSRLTQEASTYNNPSIEGGQIIHVHLEEIMLQRNRIRVISQMSTEWAAPGFESHGNVGTPATVPEPVEIDVYITLYRLITFTTHASRWNIFLFPTRIRRS